MSKPNGKPNTMSLAKQVWKPVEQASIPFYGHELVAVRLEDGRIAAILRWMCEGMGLDQQSQVRHIKGRKALTKGLIDVLVATTGGPQEAPALLLDVLPGWLITVDERRVKAEAQDDVVRFQEEAVAVLAAHFGQQRGASLALPAPMSVVEATPLAPTAPAADASVEDRVAYHEAMLTFLHWRQAIETWRAATDARQSAVEGRVDAAEEHIEAVAGQVNEIAAIIPSLVTRLGEQPLTAAHQAAIQQGVNVLHDALGVPHAAIYNDLRHAFKVAKYDQIADARWEDVRAWFGPRIAAARKQAQAKGIAAQPDPFAETPAQGRMF